MSKDKELNDVLLAKEFLNKDFHELQSVNEDLSKVNEQLWSEKVSHESALALAQADFYKLGYVDHLQGSFLIMSSLKKI